MISDTVQFVEEAYTDDYHLFKNYLLTQPLAREIWDSNTLEHLERVLRCTLLLLNLVLASQEEYRSFVRRTLYLPIIKMQICSLFAQFSTFISGLNELSAGYLEKIKLI